MKVGVGIYGDNGHQVHHLLEKSSTGILVATAAFPRELLSPDQQTADLAQHATLDAMLADPRVDLVSLCSPRRADQAGDAIRCLRAGKHVYAEKPCALEEKDLDAILQVAAETGRSFHEMAGSVFAQPYLAMRELVRAGAIGEVIQVTAEKSYPWHENRPGDEAIDGGLIGQNAIHALRLVEQVAGLRIRSVQAAETCAGNPRVGNGLRMSAVLLLTLENGALATVTANYLNPRGTGIWGYESLRLMGTRGLLESLEGGQRTRIVVGDEDRGAIDVAAPGLDYFEAYLRWFLEGTPMPLTIEDELSPTRWALRARQVAALGASNGTFQSSIKRV